MTQPALVSAVPIAFYPAFVLRVSFSMAMDLDHPNLLDPSSYLIFRNTEDEHHVQPISVEAGTPEEDYGYLSQYGYDEEPYDNDGYDPVFGYYSQQTPVFVDVSFVGEPHGFYSLRIVKPLLAANGEWLCFGTVWDDGDTVWLDSGSETLWDIP